MNNKVIKYLFSNTISNGMNFVSRWLVNYGLARFMSLSDFGRFSFIISLANLFKSVMSFGGQLFLIYKVSKEKERKYYYYLKSAFLSVAIAFTLGGILLALSFFNQTIINTNHFLFAILLASFMVLIQNSYSFFKGTGLFDKEAKGYIIYFLFVICLLLCLYFNLFAPLLINILGLVLLMHILLFIFSSFQLYKYYKADDTNEEIDDFKKNMKIFIKERAPYGFHELQSALYLNAIIIIMGFLVKDEDLAIYRSIQIIIVPISILPMIFSQVLLKQLSENIENIKYFKSLFRKFSLVAFTSGLALFFLFYFQGSWIVDLFYGNKFNELNYINELLLIFAVTYLFRFVSANYGVLITAKDKQKIRVYATSVLVIVTVVSTIILTKSMGIIGAAYANAISYFVIMIIYVVYSEFKLLRE
ncbi:MAG: oligosaccharide flippase family protein [Gammaproteobacteria bacterium]|nr:oligosaccharide flippase family protein [Gammaproteobacteria bacterium]